MDFNLDFQALFLQFIPFMMAVVFHEFAHGFVAHRYGDPTAKNAGRLTLNPIPHIDPIGTLLFPIIMMLSGVNILFGWARPVPIDPSRFKKYRPGLFWVSFAGPGMNFILALLSSLAFVAIVRFVPEDFYFFKPLVEMTRISIFLNFALGLFNLIPLPPLDGSKIVQSFLSYRATLKYESLARYSIFILLILMFTGALRFISYPIQFLSNLTVTLSAHIFGL